MSEERKEGKNEWMNLAYLGPHFLVCLLFGYWVGSQLDKWTGMKPVWTVVWSLFGIAAGFVSLFREVAKLNRQDEEAMKEQFEVKDHDGDSEQKP